MARHLRGRKARGPASPRPERTWSGISEAGTHVVRHLRGRENRVSEIRVHVNGRLPDAGHAAQAVAGVIVAGKLLARRDKQGRFRTPDPAENTVNPEIGPLSAPARMAISPASNGRLQMWTSSIARWKKRSVSVPPPACQLRCKLAGQPSESTGKRTPSDRLREPLRPIAACVRRTQTAHDPRPPPEGHHVACVRRTQVAHAPRSAPVGHHAPCPV
jgi:hypothetical protein